MCVGGSLHCSLALEVFRDSCGLEERSLCFSDLSGRTTDTGKIENDDLRETESDMQEAERAREIFGGWGKDAERRTGTV